MHIDKKFDKANLIVDSYMIYEKAERLKFFYRFLKLVFGCEMFFYIVAELDIIGQSFAHIDLCFLYFKLKSYY